jgi:hypothetical protein
MQNIIVGVDPGPFFHALVWFDGVRVVRCENLSTQKAIEAMTESTCFPVACEMIECFGMPVGREVFQTVLQIGRMQQVADWMRLIPRRDIKLHLCGNMRAKDPNVRQALIDKLGPVGTMKQPGPCYGVSNHLWSALAVAVTAFDNPITKNEWNLNSTASYFR